MKINCKGCNELVIEGELKNIENGKVFDTGLNKPQGTIIKNNSNNPKNWTGICSNCQSAESKQEASK